MQTLRNDPLLNVVYTILYLSAAIGFITAATYGYMLNEDDFSSTVYLVAGAITFGAIFKTVKNDILLMTALSISLFAGISSLFLIMIGDFINILGLSLAVLSFILTVIILLRNDK